MADNKKKKKVVAKAKVRDENKPKSPAEAPDEFVAGVGRWAQVLKPHALKIGVAAGLLAALLVAYATYQWMQQRAAARATGHFAEVLAISDRPVAEPTPDGGVPDPVPEGEPKPFKSAKARAEAVVSAADKVKAAGGVGAAAELLRARALLDLDRYEDAAKTFAEVAAADVPGEVALAAREGVGYSYEAEAEAAKDPGARQKALERSLQAFRDMQPAEDGAEHDRALYHQARILAVLGKRDEAKSLYKKILETIPGTDLKPEIESRLTALAD